MPNRAESVTGIPTVEVTDSLEESIRHRGQAYLTFKNSVFDNKDDEDSDEEILNTSQERSKSLYCRSSDGDEVNFEDFQLVSIVGKGSFGKVEYSIF